MSIGHCPVAERPRGKLLRHGSAALSDAELLAILLRTGVNGKTAVELAIDLLAVAGSLRELLEHNQRGICSVHGVGYAKFATLQASIELGRRYFESRLQRRNVVKNPDETKAFLAARLRHYPYEVFACLFLDNRHRIIRFEELFRGTIDGATVHLREILKRALELNAAALIAAHNHPSGIAEPSRADRNITRRLQQAAELIDVRVLDHVVIGDGEVVSFAERGWL